MTQEEIKERLRALVNKKKVINLEIEKLQDECLANYPIRPGDKCVDKEGRIYWVDRLLFGTLQLYIQLFLRIIKRKMERAPNVVNRFLTIVSLK